MIKREIDESRGTAILMPTISNGKPMILLFFFFKNHVPYYRENENQKRLLLLITVTIVEFERW